MHRMRRTGVQEDVRISAPKRRRTGNSRPTRSVTQQETFFSPALRAAATPVPGALFFLPPVVAYFVFLSFTAESAEKRCCLSSASLRSLPQDRYPARKRVISPGEDKWDAGSRTEIVDTPTAYLLEPRANAHARSTFPLSYTVFPANRISANSCRFSSDRFTSVANGKGRTP